jgi:hypothetical protein
LDERRVFHPLTENRPPRAVFLLGQAFPKTGGRRPHGGLEGFKAPQKQESLNNQGWLNKDL